MLHTQLDDTVRAELQALRRTALWYLNNDAWWRAIKERSAEFKAYYDKQYGTR